MPVTYDLERVRAELVVHDLSLDGTEREQRERLASHIERTYSDHLAAWEVREGRPWTDMTRDEAWTLVIKAPHQPMTPGLLTKLLGG